ncbi:MAG: BamA/TamA family outer membrane protein, partial [Desulfobulbia bacterium]
MAQYTEEPYYPTDSLQTKNLRFVGLPLAFFTPETSFGFGGGGQVFLLRKSNQFNQRESNILISAIYTLNKQILVDIKPEIYLMGGEYMLDMAYIFKIFPNSFWGIGGNTPDENLESYNMTSNELSIGFIKRLPPKLNFGFEVFFNDYLITEVDSGGLLDQDNILGSDG